jgi:hypothetical protein
MVDRSIWTDGPAVDCLEVWARDEDEDWEEDEAEDEDWDDDWDDDEDEDDDWDEDEEEDEDDEDWDEWSDDDNDISGKRPSPREWN